ncbi:MAG: outer membrane beta-barrel domain-containing protein [Myxococcota bacterium]
MTILRTTLILLAFCTFTSTGWAQDDSSSDDELGDLLGGSTGDDSSGDSSGGDLGDVLGGGTGEQTAEQEAADFGTPENTSRVGSNQPEDFVLIEDDSRKKRVIKTLQRKNFTKLKRWEVSPHVAFVANDPFLKRKIIGSGINYNITEIFAIEANFDFSPDLGESDWKPLTKQLITENHVSPDISKLTYFGSATFLFSPIYGKIAVMGRKIINFDIFAGFGMGMTHTSDDLQALDTEESDDRAVVTQNQNHPTTNFGGGARVIFNESWALRLEARSLVYIEAVNATTLEMKNNLLLQASASFFFPDMK